MIDGAEPVPDPALGHRAAVDPGDRGGVAVPLLLRLERLLRAAAVPRRASPSCSRCRSAIQQYNALFVSRADAHPGGRPHDDGRAGRRLLPRPARVHARRGRDRRREVSRPSSRRRARPRLAGRSRPSPGGAPWASPAPRPATRASHVPMIDDGDVRRRPDRRPRHGEHRADAPRRRRALAPRGRPAPLRAGGGRRLLGLRRAARRRGAATVLSTLRPDGAAGLGLDPAGGRRHVPRPLPAGLAGVRARRPRRPRSSASSSARSSPATSSSSALPVGAFEWWVENPGPDPLTVGLLLTWQDPAADPTDACPGRRWHDVDRDHATSVGAILHAPADAPPGLRGTFAIAASRAPGVDRHGPRRASTRSPTATSGPTSPPTAGSTRPTTGGRAPPARRSGRPWPRPSSWRPASGARSGSRSPGTCPMVEFGAGRRWWKRYTRDWGRTGERAFDLAAHALERDARLARRDRGLAAARPRRPPTGPTGTRRPSSTSCTSSSTAARSGRPARSAARSPTRTTRAGSRSSSAPTTRSTTRSTSTSTRRSRSCGSSRSSRRAGSATCWPRSRSTTRRS